MLRIDRRQAARVQRGQHGVAPAPAALDVLRIGPARQHDGEDLRLLVGRLRDHGGHFFRQVSGRALSVFLLELFEIVLAKFGAILGDCAEGVLPQARIDVLFRVVLLQARLVDRKTGGLQWRLPHEQNARGEKNDGDDAIVGKTSGPRFRFLVHQPLQLSRDAVNHFTMDCPPLKILQKN